MGQTIFTKQQENFMIDNYLTMKYSDIGKVINKTERQVRGWLNNHGYVKNRKINDDYFDVIDSSTKAYFLGYIFADGWISYDESRSNYELGMELQSRDKYILEKLNEELGNQNIIKHKYPTIHYIHGVEGHTGDMDCLRIYSKKLVSSLMNLGISLNKSCCDNYPIVEDKFFFDWLRGYIDGDGCYWKCKNNYYMHITCASEIILKYIQDRLLTFDIQTHIYKERDKKYRLMCVNVKEMKKLINHLYYTDDLFCLTRKYEKIKYYKGFAA